MCHSMLWKSEDSLWDWILFPAAWVLGMELESTGLTAHARCYLLSLFAGPLFYS